MAASTTTIFIFYILVLIFQSLSIGSHAEIEDQSLQRTHIHFYWQETISGTNPTTIKVVQGQDPENLFGFGAILVANINLTENSNRSSKLVGHVQGTGTVVSQTQDLGETVFQDNSNIVFTEGIYDKSTIAIFGRNAIGNKIREIPIVGGSGIFRMARGYLLLSTILFDLKSGYITFEGNAYIFHY